jgi:hypothetical protein
MTTIEQECSRHNQSTSQKLNDSEGATIEFNDPLSNSYGNQHPTIFLTVTAEGDLSVVFRTDPCTLALVDILLIFLSGRTARLRRNKRLVGNARCTRLPDRTGVVLHLGTLSYFIPRDRFSQVMKGEIPNLIVKPEGVCCV